MLNQPIACPTQPSPSAVFQGFIDERSDYHVAGWLRNLADLSERVSFQVRLADTGELLATGIADGLMPAMRGWEGDDGQHGFYVRLPRRLNHAERNNLVVHAPEGPALGLSSWLVNDFVPVSYIIMDLVDNCNLRCPFCVYDYSKTFKTNLMTQATFDAVVRFAGRVTAGNFWFSCLHEPTMHPLLLGFIEQVPRDYRNRIFFTSNLAKRMPEPFFRGLAASGLHHVNVSIESRDPAIYERMRKGARHHIFQDNWDHLVTAFAAAAAPPTLRYISLAYKSNYRELPGLVQHLLNERGGVQVEVRATYDMAHIGREFRQAEYLNQAEWLWLRDQLAPISREQLLLELPPYVDSPDYDAMLAASLAEPRSAPAAQEPGAAPASLPPDGKGYLRGRYGMRIAWDGKLVAHRVWGDPSAPQGQEYVLAEINVRDIADVDAFLQTLPV